MTFRYQSNFFLLFIVLFASKIDAAVFISDVSSSSNTIYIDGSGFGSKPSASPLLFETFESADTVGETVPSAIPSWSGRGGVHNDGSPKDMTISGESRHTGSARAARTFLSSVDGDAYSAQQIWKNNLGLSSGSKIYCNMWIYWRWVQNPVYNEGSTYYQIKSFNLATSHEPNGDAVRPYITQFIGYMYDPPTYSGSTQSYHRNGRVSHPDQSFYYNNNSIPKDYNGWVNVILVSDTGTNDDAAAVTDGWRIIQINTEGSPLPYQSKTETDKNYLDDETKGVHPIDSIKIGWFLGDNLSNGSTTLDYDDIYIDNTFQRVEIGDNAVYANCTHREIQPPTAWAGGAISATLNRGTFSPGDTAYVFVVDADNVPSTGYQITIPATRQRHRYGSSIVLQPEP